MRRSTAIWLSVASALIILGIIFLGGAMSMKDWSFKDIGTVSYETHEYSAEGEYKNISIKNDAADVELLLSDDGKTNVVCRNIQKVTYNVTVKDDTLIIEENDGRKWYEKIQIGIIIEPAKIKVYLPCDEYGSLVIKGSTGDVNIPKDISFGSIDIAQTTGDVKNYASAKDIKIVCTTGQVKNYASADNIKIASTTGNITVQGIETQNMELSATTGKIKATDVTCRDDIKIDVTTGKCELDGVTCTGLDSKGDTGSIHMKDLIASEKITVKRDTGDVRFEDCDASEIYVKTDTGDITGSFLTDKVCYARSETGREDVPKLTAGGKCEMISDTGDIKVEIKKKG